MRFYRFFPLLLIALLCLGNRLSAATTIPFQFRDGMIWVKVAVAGQGEELNFLLDSGAGATVLDLAVARRLNLPCDQPRAVEGVHGRTLAYRVKDFPGRVGSVPAFSSALALDLSGPSATCHRRIDGLLGADFFRNRIVQIDFAAETICLLKREEVNLRGCEVLPLSARNDTFCARISVNDNPPEWLRLDTGCNSALEWVVTASTARRLGLAPAEANSGAVREIHTDVQLGAKRIGAMKTGIHTTQMFAGESGLIGNGLLSRFTVTIDTARRCCLLASR